MRFSFYIAFLMLLPTLAFAGVSINEIMYDLDGSDSGREWVEIFNNSDEVVDLSGWKFHENETDHKISLVNEEGNFMIPANGYAIISDNPDKFLIDWPDFSGIIFNSVFSLHNSGEILVIKDSELNDINEVSYLSEWGASGDGNSLQKLNGEWLASSPTPGKLNKLEANPPSEGLPEQQQETETQTVSNVPNWPTEPQIYANAGKDVVTVAGAGVTFSGQALGINKELMDGARYLWSFGDGFTKEGKTVTHFYKYPAKYIVVANVSSGQYSASDNLIVDVRPNELKILEANNDYIKLKNGSPFVLDISGWFLMSGKKIFRFPETTLIGANLELPIPSSITEIMGISLSNKIDILYPNGVIAFSFDRFAQPKVVPVVSAVKKTDVIKNTISTSPSIEKEKEVVGEENEPDNYQVASAIKSTAITDSLDKLGARTFWNVKNTFLIVLGLSFFVGISLVFSRRQNKNPTDQFEIVE